MMSRLQPQIRFEDQHLMVIYKPAGLLSQADHTGANNLVDWARDYLGRHYVGLIHRLDRNTSGLMLLAKRSKAAQRLTAALLEGTVIRHYLAWVEGSLTGDGSWQHRLQKDAKSNTSRVVTQGGKLAQLDYQCLQQATWRGNTISLLRLQLQTGRSHQIRLQAATAGHPLLGDVKYGSRLGFEHLALHSAELQFQHPMTLQTHQFSEPLPAYLQLAMK